MRRTAPTLDGSTEDDITTYTVAEDTNGTNANFADLTITVTGVDDAPENGTDAPLIGPFTPDGSIKPVQSFALGDFIRDPDKGEIVTYSIVGLSGVPPTGGGVAQNLADYADWIGISGTSLDITPQAEMKAGTYTVTITGTSSGVLTPPTRLPSLMRR